MKTTLVSILLIFLVFACSQSEPAEASKEMKMAEDSELALLMRSIHEDAKAWRIQLVDGEQPSDSIRLFEALTTSTPTKPEVQGPVFEGYANLYQTRLDSLFRAGDLNIAKGAYNNLIASCVDCHQGFCPGPIPTIEKLYIGELNSPSQLQ